MIQNWKDKSQNITLKSLQAQLRNLPELKLPEQLKEKLFAAIPENKTTVSDKQDAKRWSLTLGLGAAAAVFIMALIFLSNYGPKNPSIILAELNDTSSCFVFADNNSSRAEANKPSQLLWQTIGQNEPPTKN